MGCWFLGHLCRRFVVLMDVCGSCVDVGGVYMLKPVYWSAWRWSVWIYEVFDGNSEYLVFTQCVRWY